jgi:hypothetical protein
MANEILKTADPIEPDGQRATRAVRIIAMSLLVLGIEWGLADPAVIAADPQRWPIPYSMLCMIAPMTLGIWAFENTSDGYGGFRLDALWSIVVGTLLYVGFSVIPPWFA